MNWRLSLSGLTSSSHMIHQSGPTLELHYLCFLWDLIAIILHTKLSFKALPSKSFITLLVTSSRTYSHMCLPHPTSRHPTRCLSRPSTDLILHTRLICSHKGSTYYNLLFYSIEWTHELNYALYASPSSSCSTYSCFTKNQPTLQSYKSWLKDNYSNKNQMHKEYICFTQSNPIKELFVLIL